MTESKKHNTPSAEDDDVKATLDRTFAGVAPVKPRVPSTLPYDYSDPLQWMRFAEARRHVARVVGRLEWAAQDLIRGIVLGEIPAAEGLKSELTPSSPEEFRGIDVDDNGRLLEPGWHDAVSDDHIYVLRAVVERKWRAFLPRKRPADVDRKVWLVITKVWALWAEGYRWPHQEALRDKVCERLNWDPKKDLSLPTVRTALDWMRKEDYVDL